MQLSVVRLQLERLHLPVAQAFKLEARQSQLRVCACQRPNSNATNTEALSMPLELGCYSP